MMVKTHYDNLKVARNAPDDVIRAAYRSLIEKYHPSRNPGAEAARITKILDEAFEMLTDPVRRKNHDQWIKQEERKEAMERVAPDASFSPPLHTTPNKKLESFMSWARSTNGGRVLAGVFLGGLILLLVWQGQQNNVPDINAPRTGQPYNPLPVSAPSYVPPPVIAPKLTQPYDGSLVGISPAIPTTSDKPVYLRPALTPKGHPWPTKASYLDGYRKLATDGNSLVHVDNAQGDSDVMVKIVSIGGATAFPVRVFYIPAHGKFTATNLPPGKYDMRFCTLADGALSRSDTFALEETTDTNGSTRYSDETLTLYSVLNGNMQMHPLNPADF